MITFEEWAQSNEASLEAEFSEQTEFSDVGSFLESRYESFKRAVLERRKAGCGVREVA